VGHFGLRCGDRSVCARRGRAVTTLLQFHERSVTRASVLLDAVARSDQAGAMNE
jgi:hypothetical protein